ncbi:MAG: calcium-binding protein, partial [Oscillatoriales cyanobacterium RM1_1_9]|nr:calcium-binding protein [Oscillatoriales cyanobacterium RM1_1_9]
MNGNQGEDTVWGDEAADTVFGGRDSDSLLGGADPDLLLGNLGNDQLFGETGNDSLWGGQNDDQLLGGAGADLLSGDLGIDTLTGGEGSDLFWLGVQTDPNLPPDQITDFEPGLDRIVLLGGLTATDIEFEASSAGTRLKLIDTETSLGILIGIQPNQLRDDDIVPLAAAPPETNDLLIPTRSLIPVPQQVNPETLP